MQSKFKRPRRGKRAAAARRSAKRSTALRLTRRVTSTPIINVQRTFWWENWVPTSVATSNFWRYYTFRLQDLPSYLDFAAPFDRFKINGIKVTFRPKYDNFAGNDTTDTTLPGVTNQAGTRLSIINDPVSNYSPSGVYGNGTYNQFLENGKVRIQNGNKDVNVYFKPMVNSETGGLSAGRRIRAPMLQCSQAAGLVHNGFHIFANDVNFTGVFGQSWDVYVTYYMTFTGLRP